MRQHKEREKTGLSRGQRLAIAGLLALFSLGLAVWLTVSPPAQKSSSGGDRRGSRSSAEQQLAFQTGQLFGTVAGIWGGALGAALLVRSARIGPRGGRRSLGVFALLFGLGVVSTLGGLVLMWIGATSRDIPDGGTLMMRLGGAATAIAGAVCLAYVLTRPLRPTESGTAPAAWAWENAGSTSDS